jgi:predicted ATPase
LPSQKRASPQPTRPERHITKRNYCGSEVTALLLWANRTSRAPERGYLDSLEVAHAQKALSWELRTSMSFLNLLTKQKRETEGKSRLGEVYSRFSQGFNTQDLVNARRLLEGSVI